MRTFKGRLQDSVEEIYRRTQRLSWRARNFGRVLQYHLSSKSDEGMKVISNALRREGIAIFNLRELASNTYEVFLDAQTHAHDLLSRVAKDADADEGCGLDGGVTKKYRIRLLSKQIASDSPFLALALDSRLLAAVDSYMGMRSYLRSIDLWWDRPTSGPEMDTQLWHRDADDLMNVKVFIYFNDVDVDGGPFCFIRGSHPRGGRRRIMPEFDDAGRTTDGQMANLVPPSGWSVCTGSIGTVIMCDTCGYHKGLKPLSKDRIMFVSHYTSGTPRYPRSFELLENNSNGLSSRQLDRLG